MADNVKVAVRVRPFNSRENTRNSTLIIEMIGKSTEIKDPENPNAEPRKFAFDYSYWSHDDFTERADGYLEPKSPKYADQQIVFNDLGLGVLDNAWMGYNTSLFAYGQTGSGKSYSMVGYGVNKGIVPLACEELFSAIEKKRVDAKEGEEYQVTFSMLEIYNEQVRDLLNPASLKIKGGLKVRQHSNKGFYVEALMTVPVNSYTEIDSKINEGTKNRTVASTNMNATSSRAHTIVAINFTQKSPNAAGQSMTKTSVINLVDLAGSERADATGATGDRLKEGAGINQSLSTLGNCIKALADMSQGKKSIIVPFRDSVLTKLLKNALGGNSKTIMIAALSPADINYDETLSTLRFADRAKAIKTQAVVNESPTEKLIRELREENARLMDMLKSGGTMPAAPASGGGGGGGGGDATAVEEMRKQMEDELRRNQEEMAAMQETWQQKMAEREKEFAAEIEATQLKKEQQKTIPHFWNLNEDPSLTAMIVHFTPKGKTRLGSSKANPPPDIMLAGLSIQPEHALVEYDGKKKVTLLPLPGAKVVLNGNEIKEKKELHHNDRVLFGSTNLFVYHHPQDYAKQQKDNKIVPAPSYDSAQEEIAKSSGLSKFTSGGKSKDDLILQEDLIEMFPMVSEANAISEELDKKCKFELALISPQARGKKDGRTEVCVKMRNLGNDTEFMWDRSKFINRKFLMQEMYQDYVNGDDDWDLPKERDPFWEDPGTEVHLGSVHVYLQSLAYMMELEESLQVTDYRGIEQGRLQVEIVPCKKDGKELDDEYVDDPEELVGKDLYFKVKVPNARGLPSRYSSTSCKYKLYLDDEATTTKEVAGMNPEYGHEKQYTFHPVTKQFVDYLQNEALLIEVWGRQKDGTGSGAPLTTRELVTREMSMVDLKTKETPKANGKSSVQPGMTAGEKRRMEKAEEKLNNIQTLLNAAKKSSSAVVQVKDVERILAGGASKFTQDNSNQAKDEKMGTNASQACLIQ